MAEKNEKLTSFAEWLKKEGAEFPDIELYHQSDEMGFGIKTKKKSSLDTKQLNRIPANSSLIRIPTHLLLTISRAKKCPTIGPFLQTLDLSIGNEKNPIDERVLLFIFLIDQRNRRHNSFWFHYIDLLPTDMHTVAMCWPENELKQHFEGLPLYTQVQVMKTEVQQMYDEIFVKQLFVSPLFPKEVFTREALLWAYLMFWSRAIQVPDTTSNTSANIFGGVKNVQHCEAFVPLVDLLNHRPGTLTEWKQVGNKNQLDLVYSSSLPFNSPIFLNYGAKSNEELIKYYGFTLCDNMADSTVLSINLVHSDSTVNRCKRVFTLFKGQYNLTAALLDAIRREVSKKDCGSCCSEDDMVTSNLNIYGIDSAKAIKWSDYLLEDQDKNTFDILMFDLGFPISLQNEMEMLEKLNHILDEQRHRISMLSRSTTWKRKHESDQFNRRSELAAVYRRGIDVILQQAKSQVLFLKKQIRVAS